MWTRHDPPTAPAGDIGGDYQVSDAWSARWSRDLGNGTFAVVTRSYYLTSWHGGGLECQTEYLVCHDPLEPGSTEVSSFGVTELVASDDPRASAVTAPEPTDAEWEVA